MLHPAETISTIYSILLKKSLFEYWQKIDVFQLFHTFHKDFSKDLWSEVIKSTCFLVRYFLLNYFKDLSYNSKKIQQIFFVGNNESTFSQHPLTKENNRRCTIYENLWNDDVNHLLLFSLANECWLNIDSLMTTKNICWIFLLLYHKSLK